MPKFQMHSLIHSKDIEYPKVNNPVTTMTFN